MHDGNVLASHVIHDDLSDLGVLASVPQEQQVSSLKGRLHGSREDDDNGRAGVCDHAEPFPEHEGGAENKREVEHLGGQLARLHG